MFNTVCIFLVLGAIQMNMGHTVQFLEAQCCPKPESHFAAEALPRNISIPRSSSEHSQIQLIQANLQDRKGKSNGLAGCSRSRSHLTFTGVVLRIKNGVGWAYTTTPGRKYTIRRS